MRPRRVTPPTIVAGLSKVWWAKVSGSDEDRRTSGVTPVGVVCALDFEAGAAAEPIVEQRRAQRSCAHTVTLAVKITVSTSTSCKQHKLLDV